MKIFSAALHRYIEKLQTEDLGDLQKKHEQQQAIQEEIEILNQQKELQKKKRMEEDKMQEMQVLKMKKKSIKLVHGNKSKLENFVSQFAPQYGQARKL